MSDIETPLRSDPTLADVWAKVYLAAVKTYGHGCVGSLLARGEADEAVKSFVVAEDAAAYLRAKRAEGGA